MTMLLLTNGSSYNEPQNICTKAEKSPKKVRNVPVEKMTSGYDNVVANQRSSYNDSQNMHVVQHIGSTFMV